MARGRAYTYLIGAALALGCGRKDFEDVEPGVDAADQDGSGMDGGAPGRTTVATYGHLGDDAPVAVTIGLDGNVLVAGHFRGLVDFGCPPLSSAGGADGFVLELTPALGCVRTWSIGGEGNDLATDIAEDRSGNLVVVGEFRSTATMTSGPSLTAQFARDIFLTKLTPGWEEVWTRQLPGNSADQTYELINRVRTDSSGGVHAFGRIWGTVQFGWGGTTQTFTDNGWGDAFVLRVTSDGAYIGTDMFGGGGSEQTYGMAIDDQDDVYIAGNYRGTVDFDPGPATLSKSGDFDGFVERRRPDNTLAWANVEEGGGWRPYQAIATKAGGQLAGVQNDLFTLSPAIVLRTFSLDTSTGTVVWSKEIPAGEGAYALALTTDGAGNVYVGGRFANSVDFAPSDGGDRRTAVGGVDCYLQRYDADGTLRWTITFGGPGDDQIAGIAVLAPDDLVVVGTFQDEVDFGEQTIDVHRAIGGTDIFVRRLTR